MSNRAGKIRIGTLWAKVVGGKLQIRDSSDAIPARLHEASLPPASVGLQLDYSGTNSQGWFDDPLLGRLVYLSLDTVRTIGGAGSGADIGDAWLETLFTHIWIRYNNTRCPIFNSNGSVGARGTGAAEDFAANKRLSLPDLRGRFSLPAGSGDGLTAHTFGDIGGTEEHTDVPAHSHTTGDGAQFVEFVGSGGSAAGNGPGPDYTIRPTTGIEGLAGVNHLPPFWVTHRVIASGYRA